MASDREKGDDKHQEEEENEEDEEQEEKETWRRFLDRVSTVFWTYCRDYHERTPQVVETVCRALVDNPDLLGDEKLVTSMVEDLHVDDPRSNGFFRIDRDLDLNSGALCPDFVKQSGL